MTTSESSAPIRRRSTPVHGPPGYASMMVRIASLDVTRSPVCGQWTSQPFALEGLRGREVTVGEGLAIAGG